MNRVPAHFIETKSKDYIRKIIDEYKEGNALYRDLTERDYGIDGIIELFYHGNPTGKIAFLQIKGTSQTIVPLRNKDVVACKISSSNAKYALQNNIPVMLIYTTIEKPLGFYYTTINDIIKKKDMLKKINKQKTITVHIPIENNALENMECFFNIIQNFYDKGND